MLVALTGWGQQEDRRKSQDAGFDHHLVKPVTGRGSEADRVIAAPQATDHGKFSYRRPFRLAKLPDSAVILSLSIDSRSCFSAAERDKNVPRLRRLPVFAFFFAEYSR